MMESFGIKGYDKGGRIPINQRGSRIVKKNALDIAIRDDILCMQL